MTTFLELTVSRTNGQHKVERVERDDRKGREQMDKVAFALMASRKVRWCKVSRTDRKAGR